MTGRNCARTLDRIDALSLGGDRARRLEEIDRHVRGCPACRRALAVALEIERSLSGLEEPLPPSSIESSISWQLSRSERAEAADRPSTGPPAGEGARAGLRWTALGLGVSIALGVAAYRWLAGEALLVAVPPALRAWVAGLLEARRESGANLALTLGLAAGSLLYATSLFGMLRGTRKLGSDGAGGPVRDAAAR